jgi:hypothetical protein
MADRKVKGTMLLNLVRMIRANKSQNWNKYLKPEDWEVINKRILPSEWYPLEVFQRCGVAIFQVLAQANLDIVRQSGRMQGKKLFENVYKSVVISQDPAATLSRFVTVYNQFFNFSTVRFENAGMSHVQIHHDYDTSQHPGTVPYCYQLMGILDVLVEVAGGKNIKIELKAKQWEIAPTTIFDITWE